MAGPKEPFWKWVAGAIVVLVASNLTSIVVTANTYGVTSREVIGIVEDSRLGGWVLENRERVGCVERKVTTIEQDIRDRLTRLETDVAFIKERVK